MTETVGSYGPLSAVLALDERLSRWAAGPDNRPGFRKFCRVLTHCGDGVVHLPILAALFYLGDAPTKLAVCRIVIATAVGLAFMYAIRPVFGRRRPIGDIPREYALLPVLEKHSFPSGHALRNFILPPVFGAVWPEAVIPLAIYAALIGLARVALRLHYLSDIAGGALLGWAIGWAALRITIPGFLT